MQAHKLKNTSTKIFEAAVQIQTKYRYGLTGTAMQNDFGELWALLSWAVPGDMPDWKQFEGFYVSNIKMGQRKQASKFFLAKACFLPYSVLSPERLGLDAWNSHVISTCKFFQAFKLQKAI